MGDAPEEQKEEKFLFHAEIVAADRFLCVPLAKYM
jgi:hypothetical protein